MSFLDKVKGAVDKGVEVSKDAFTKAGSAVQDFGDKSVLRIEIKQLESKIEKSMISLGNKAFESLSADPSVAISLENAEISEIVTQIKSYQKDIEQREAELNEKE